MSELSDTATIYRVVHSASGRCYVGHTSAPVRFRFSQHRTALRKGRHHSAYFQKVWSKYGEDAFLFEVIEVCAEADKLVREQHWIDTLKSAFNHCKVAGSRLGMKMPPHEVERLRQMMKGNQYTKGRVMPEDERARHGAPNIGSKRTPAQRANMSAAMRGVPHPNAPKVRPPHTAEVKAKIKAARAKQVLKPRSEEAKERARQTMRAYFAAHVGEPWGRQRSNAPRP